MISDENVQVVWQKRYTPFGGDEEESGTLDNTYQFTGKGWDEDAGLFYFNARWYDPDVGRFISEDPLWGSIWDPQSLNRFAYGRNNPYGYVDPTGMMTMDQIGGYSINDGDGGHTTATSTGAPFDDADGGESNSDREKMDSTVNIEEPPTGLSRFRKRLRRNFVDTHKGIFLSLEGLVPFAIGRTVATKATYDILIDEKLIETGIFMNPEALATRLVTFGEATAFVLTGFEIGIAIGSVSEAYIYTNEEIYENLYDHPLP